MLTGPNMAWKSSLMHSMLTASLLANCGLMAPTSSARMPRYNVFFKRTSSFDASAEGKSAFAQEMEDVDVILMECSSRLLIMLDELGRGTLITEGSVLCVALLEWLDARSMNVVFATHLHEIEGSLSLLPPLRRLSRKCLQATAMPDGSIQMSFTVSDGVSRDSLAMYAARRAGLPEPLIARAEALMQAGGTATHVCKGLSGVGSHQLEGSDIGAALPPFTVLPSTEAGNVVDVCAEKEQDSPSDMARQQLSAAGEGLHVHSGGKKLVHVPATWQPPPNLSGCSRVYILHICWDKSAAGSSGSLCVSKTDDIRARLEQHRRKNSGGLVSCVLVVVESKTRQHFGGRSGNTLFSTRRIISRTSNLNVGEHC